MTSKDLHRLWREAAAPPPAAAEHASREGRPVPPPPCPTCGPRTAEGWGWCTSCGRLNPTRSAGYRCEVCT